MMAETAPAFRSVTFGGFDKNDVMAYIEKNAQEHESALEALRGELAAAKEALAAAQAAGGETEQSRLALEEELVTVRADCEKYRADAESFTHFRDRIAQIEFDARAKADQILNDAKAEAEETLSKARAEAEETLTSARTEAEETLNSARTEAETLTRDTQNAINAAQEESEQNLREQEAAVNGRIRNLLSELLPSYSQALDNFRTLSSQFTTESRKIEVYLTQMSLGMGKVQNDIKALDEHYVAPLTEEE